MSKEKRPEGTEEIIIVSPRDGVYRRRVRCIHYIKNSDECSVYGRRCVLVAHCAEYKEAESEPVIPKPTAPPKPKPYVPVRPLLPQLINIGDRVEHCPVKTKPSLGVGRVLQLMCEKELFKVRFESGDKVFGISALKEGIIRVLDGENP